MKKKQLIPMALILVCALAAAGAFLLREKQDPDHIAASGNIEVTDVSLGFKVAGRLAQCLKDEGDPVKKGEILARLENDDQKIALALARTGLAAARSTLEELENGSRPEEIRQAEALASKARQQLLELTRGSRVQEVETARADLERAAAAREAAKVQLTQAREDFQRYSHLIKEQSVSERDFTLARTRFRVARNTLSEAQARVIQAKQTLSLVQEGPRSEQIAKARADLAQAEAGLALAKAGPRKEKIDQARIRVREAEQRVAQAKLALSYTELAAPMDGVIFSRSAEPGEFLNPATPVLVLGDLAHPWLRAYVGETALGRLKLGQEAVVSIDTFPGKAYPGTLTFISSEAEFTPKAVQTFEERVKLMFRIKISLPNPDGELRPGMPADVRIQARGL